LKKPKAKKRLSPAALPKSPTGITGLDEITNGGLPTGRPTLVAGSAGCGKTLLGLEFLVRGAQQFDEPGVFVAFEETAPELAVNVRSLGFNLEEMIAQRQLVIDHIHIERSEIEETGQYDLSGLFVRLGYAIDSIGAKRVVLDTIEVLFSGLSEAAILRAELRRLFTGERGEQGLTRYGIEEYVSDCVIQLDHRVVDQVSTRRLRIIKYRGTMHGTNEYPFLIDNDGISVLPITSLTLDHPASTERISSGIPRLDTMLEGHGFFRGSSILITGTAGVGKTSIAGSFVNAACARGERCLYFALEEAEQQITRNMRSIGLQLARWVQRDLLCFQATRPTLYGLEAHLAVIHKQVLDFAPQVVVIDPVTNLTAVGNPQEVEAALMRFIDFLKSKGITGMFTSLTDDPLRPEQSSVGISSLMDTWILLRNVEMNGERNRGLYILKSRGMAHSNQIREFLLTDTGVQLADVYLGGDGMLLGTARIAQEIKEQNATLERQREIERRHRELERKRSLMETQIAALQAAFEEEQEDLQRLLRQEQLREDQQIDARRQMAQLRHSDTPSSANGKRSNQAKGEDYGSKTNQTSSQRTRKRVKASHSKK
jgi:circadian clock protein KaiC